MGAAAKRPTAKAPTRAELCRELLELERDNPEIFRRMEEIKVSLKLAADQDGSFRETFEGLGYVSVSPSKPEQITGEAPKVDIAEWNMLTAARRQKHLDSGIIVMAPLITRASYGQVRTKLHASPQGAAR